MEDETFERMFRQMVEAVRRRHWELRPGLPPHRERLRQVDACARLCDWVEARLPDLPNDPRSGRLCALLDIIDAAAFGEKSADDLLREARDEVFAATIRVESWTELFGLRFPTDRVELTDDVTIEWLGEERHAELTSQVRTGGLTSDLQILPLERSADEYRPDFGWVVCHRWSAPRPFDKEAGEACWNRAVRDAERLFCVMNVLFEGGWRSGASFYLVRGRTFSPTMRSRPPWGSGDHPRTLSEADLTRLREAWRVVHADEERYTPALLWYEAGLFQKERPHLRFVSWAMALEALALGGDPGANIGSRLAQALAAHGVEEAEARRIWRVRSDLVHGRHSPADEVLRREADTVRGWFRHVFAARVDAARRPDGTPPATQG